MSGHFACHRGTSGATPLSVTRSVGPSARTTVATRGGTIVHIVAPAVAGWRSRPLGATTRAARPGGGGSLAGRVRFGLHSLLDGRGRKVVRVDSPRRTLHEIAQNAPSYRFELRIRELGEVLLHRGQLLFRARCLRKPLLHLAHEVEGFFRRL